ncbi:hypothetical protein K9M74_00630, partial [Candidatus Woesearchaeota archaeon]|nr:hypothetical protein [Candidatus Woesearchaeota archaeon]
TFLINLSFFFIGKTASICFSLPQCYFWQWEHIFLSKKLETWDKPLENKENQAVFPASFQKVNSPAQRDTNRAISKDLQNQLF